MITAINTANRNNNVNFKGKGQLVNVTPYKLTKRLIETLRNEDLDFAIIQSINQAKTTAERNTWRVFGPIADHLGLSLNSLKKCWTGLDLGKVSSQVLDLREICTAKETCDRKGIPAILIAAKSWKASGARGKIDGFEPELIEFFTKKLGILSKKRTIGGVPLESVTVVGGNHTVPNDFRRVANTVIVEGGQLDNTKFKNVSINRVNDPNLNIEDAFSAYVLDSNIGSFKGRYLAISGSTAGDVTVGKWLDVAGKTELSSVKTGACFTCQEGSVVRIKGDAQFPNIILDPNSQLVVDGKIGTKDQKVNSIFVQHGSGLKVDETHAGELFPQKGARFETRVWDIGNAPFGVEIGHQIGKFKKWVESLGESAIESVISIRKIDNTKL